jgi:hypothetical protein
MWFRRKRARFPGRKVVVSGFEAGLLLMMGWFEEAGGRVEISTLVGYHVRRVHLTPVDNTSYHIIFNHIIDLRGT